MKMPPCCKQATGTTSVSAKMRLSVIFAVLVFIGGCASTQSDDELNESKGRRAAESNTSLGLEYMNRGQYEVALGKLKKAVKEDPGYAPGQTVLAVLYERIGEDDLAGKHYKLAYQADPTDGDVNNNYGVYLCKTGKQGQALSHLEKALDDPFYNSPAVALTNAGSCALSNDDLVEAEKYLRRALSADPEFPDALMNMARLNYEQQNYLSARAFMQRYEAVAQHGPESLLLGFNIETASRDSKAANKYKLALQTNFPESDQAAEVRRISGK